MATANVRRRTAREIEDDLAKDARRIVQFEMKRHGYSYKELARLLHAKGFGEENDVQLKTKINRGKFSFVFVIRVMRAFGDANVSVAELPRRDPLFGVSD